MAYTEFYCNASTGSNVNGGSDAGSVTYTSTNGNWSTVTNVFTPTDGTNPVSAGVVAGQFASLYIDGASVAVYIARVTLVVNAANGAITMSSTAKAGTAPTTSATTRTIKVGGAWKGPNAASGFPFSLTGGNLNAATDSSADPVRVNLKNNSTYSITSGVIAAAAGASFVIYQGYSSTTGDGGKAIIDGGTTANLTIFTGVAGLILADCIIASSATSGSGIGIGDGAISNVNYIRVVSHGHRLSGFQTGSSFLYECESYDNNKSNSSTASQRSGFSSSNITRYVRCISHDNAGSNTYGFENAAGVNALYQNCIADSNGSDGFNYLINGASSGVTYLNCDSYNNGGDGIGIDFTSSTIACVIIENCNFIKNTGWGINNTTAIGKISTGFVYNCGYGSGTQVNGSGDATLVGLQESSKVTYANNVTPWVDPANGDFRINLAAANFAGRAAFTQTAASYAGTAGYPDIGAAQSLTGPSGTFSKEASYGHAQ